ncbi:uncharacterized protein PRCAT00004068001 [Priceomyces carsonii]|uniref:uncharacterized protein n=1 Tax=Priceomyces carsonii TaxID=28549 RepID=UPI002EDA6584|nr:unnamed protein product [Priceomyces carsonii]
MFIPIRLYSFLACLWFLQLTFANKIQFDNSLSSQVCSGMYSKDAWGGSMKPHIGIRLNEYNKKKYDSKKHKQNDDGGEDISVSFVIFEYKDISHIGHDLGNGHYSYICDDDAISAGFCEKSHRGKFLMNANVTNSTIMTSQLTHFGNAHINYTVHRTGYYCIATYSMAHKKYKGIINFQNAYGHLSASEIPKLPAYGILTLCYAIALALFGFQFFKKRKENQILPLQKYLLAMLGFLTFDTLVVWSYYDLVNRTKNPTSKFTKFYMVFLSLMNSTKITFSFFLLLCIALGYGVVFLKLDKPTMLKCKILAGCHFLASAGYLISTYYTGSSTTTISSNSFESGGMNGLLGLIPLIPIGITLTIYYISILVAIRRTTANLHQQRQIIKLQLYENLFKIIFLSVVLTFGGLILSSFIYLSMSSTEMIEQHWKGAFFIFEFWPSVVFFGVFICIAWLWRPTETSYMLAISQQLSTDENADEETAAGGYHQGHEFELDDLSLLSHSDNEHGDNDSFELDNEGASAAPLKSNPPDYEELEGTKKHDEPSNSNSSTLFNIGDGGDSDSENDADDRLKNTDHDG